MACPVVHRANRGSIPTLTSHINSLHVHGNGPGAGLVSGVLDYVLLDGGSAHPAPALLVLGYVVGIRLGIIWQVKDREKGA